MQHMKRYVKLLTALLAGAFLATACYEDKGNYDYSTTGDDILVYRMDTMQNVRLTWSYDESTERLSPRSGSWRSTRCASGATRARSR